MLDKTKSEEVVDTGANDIPKALLDCLNFEDTNQQLEVLKELIFNEPISNETKINFLREEIDAGRYQIESQVIANKMTESYKPEQLSLEEVETL